MTTRLPDFISDTIDAWSSDFADAPAYDRLPGVIKESAVAVARAFLTAACEAGDCGPGDIGEETASRALLERMPALDLPLPVRERIPDVVAAFLGWLEDAGRLADGRALGMQVAAAAEAYRARLNAKGGAKAPPLTAASNVGRNDPCPCGSGKKFKKCCG